MEYAIETAQCPFCGCGKAYPDYVDGAVGEWFVYCPSCCARGPVVWKHHRSDHTCKRKAKLEWNRRNRG